LSKSLPTPLTCPLSPCCASLYRPANKLYGWSDHHNKGEYAIYTVTCLVCFADPYAMARLAALIKVQAIALVEEVSKKRNEKSVVQQRVTRKTTVRRRWQ
jgi:hypothetical protein